MSSIDLTLPLARGEFRGRKINATSTKELKLGPGETFGEGVGTVGVRTFRMQPVMIELQIRSARTTPQSRRVEIAHASLTAAEARELARALLAQADEVEAPPQAWVEQA